VKVVENKWAARWSSFTINWPIFAGSDISFHQHRFTPFYLSRALAGIRIRFGQFVCSLAALFSPFQSVRRLKLPSDRKRNRILTRLIAKTAVWWVNTCFYIELMLNLSESTKFMNDSSGHHPLYWKLSKYVLIAGYRWDSRYSNKLPQIMLS
jgi:hypothetical protein